MQRSARPHLRTGLKQSGLRAGIQHQLRIPLTFLIKERQVSLALDAEVAERYRNRCVQDAQRMTHHRLERRHMKRRADPCPDAADPFDPSCPRIDHIYIRICIPEADVNSGKDRGA